MQKDSMTDWEKRTAAELREKLEEGRLSGEREGYFTEEEVDRYFEKKLKDALAAEAAEHYGE